MGLPGAAKMFRAAIISATETRANDPATMTALDELCEGWQNGTDGMLAALWNHPEVLLPYDLCGIGYSTRKQAAVLTVTGRSWKEWLKLMNYA